MGHVSVLRVQHVHAHLVKDAPGFVFVLVKVAHDEDLLAFVNQVLCVPVMSVTLALEFRVQL